MRQMHIKRQQKETEEGNQKASSVNTSFCAGLEGAVVLLPKHPGSFPPQNTTYAVYGFSS